MSSSAETADETPRPPRVAADLMDAQPPMVSPQTSVGDVARLLVERHLSGVPVVTPTGELIGLVTQADLVTRHAHVHFPFYLNLLGGVIPFGERHFRQEMRRITGRTAADVMSEDPYTVDEDTPLEDIATRMAEDGIDPVVVVRGDKLAGLITREHLVRLVVSEEAPTG
jgi:CBS domain-containing protein